MSNPSPKSIIIAGGWEGHAPAENARLIADALRERAFTCDVVDNLEVLDDAELLQEMDLIIPMWTMGKLTGQQQKNLCNAVRGGTGLGGTHGGMGDAFRGSLDYEWMVGGHFVGHPHVGPYSITILRPEDPIVNGMPIYFDYDSEQYYVLVDPGIHVLAITAYTHDGKTCEMPVVWTKSWGEGRVFYSALGHDMAEFERWPYVLEMTVRGLLWAAGRA